jgi:pimeloyl-ACP methyl ester carboxylesterase
MTTPNAITHHYAQVNGIQMHYIEAGSGEPVVLLHGFPEFWYSWRHQIAALAPHYRVIVPDQRGYNETESAGPYDTGTLQDDVIALLDHLG